jgi:hypothetical protein
LHGNLRTKWQRKGRLHIARLFENIAKTAAAAAVGMDLMRQAVERIHPVTFPSGGIVIPPPPRTERMMVGESTGEIVLHRPQLDRLKHVIMDDPMDGIRATIEAPNFSDIFEKISKRNQE